MALCIHESIRMSLSYAIGFESAMTVVLCVRNPLRTHTVNKERSSFAKDRDHIYMEKLHISGGRRLNGIVQIGGMKNAALPILFACALNDETCELQNVPQVQDISTTVELLRSMGVSISYITPTTLRICGIGFRPCTGTQDLIGKIRASAYLMGVELARCGHTRAGYPGGCDFGGSRPLDYHTRAFELMGAEMRMNNGFCGDVPDGLSLHDTKIMLDTPSVGATVNIMLGASLIPGGLTVIQNAAREPHIADLARFLTECGATVKGAGTSEIKIFGTEALHGCTYKIIPDMIEAGTYMAAVAGTGGCVRITNVIPKHLEAITNKLRDMGVTVIDEESETSVTVCSDGRLKGVQIKTDAYPGFPTDMHPQFAVLLAMADGIGTITENIWAGRFVYLNELMKAGITYSHVEASNMVTCFGSQTISPATMSATDLRGGAAMVMAALIAKGESYVLHPECIYRGYEDIVNKLSKLGANISSVQVFNPGTLSAVNADHLS